MFLHCRICALCGLSNELAFVSCAKGKHVVMTDGRAILTIPRHNPVNRWTLAGIIREAGLSVDEFRKLC